MKLERNLFYVLVSEMLFTILPLIVITIVRSYQNQYELIFYNTEWAMMSIILYGQSIVKFSSGVANSNLKFRWQLVSLIMSLIIIFGLVPSIIILIINLLNSEPNFGLHIAQMLLFIVSIITFFIVGYVGQKLIDGKKQL
ncbi:hypothetical protein [Flavobacterium sandaracinum]|uniref:Uncharacterized protein n=1 Tax=Flavobacterium sandaracinum TaxID=2541733 RepID=A0A4R5CV20_9FLAO|nr:hypothetical protein [Flavobacterium sandaracinum]TDE01705.1 hypothetical protein E0F91_14185 [Flavobacterium sandaracinum]